MNLEQRIEELEHENAELRRQAKGPAVRGVAVAGALLALEWLKDYHVSMNRRGIAHQREAARLSGVMWDDAKHDPWNTPIVLEINRVMAAIRQHQAVTTTYVEINDRLCFACQMMRIPIDLWEEWVKVTPIYKPN